MLESLLRWLKRQPRRKQAVEVIVYSRQGCHLCEEALALLRRYERPQRLLLREVDIDGAPELVARYGDRVPVVVVAGKVRFFGKVNEVLLGRLLRELK